VSGICGICEPGTEISKALIQSMLAMLVSADENGHEYLMGSSVAFGAAKRWASQELATISGVRLAADTDIINWKDVVAYLEGKGICASQMHRGEALAWLYTLDGIEFVQRLEGAFAISLWDEKEQRLLLAIDPLGIKTLYFTKEGSKLSFSSRVGAVRASQQRPSVVNANAVMQYLIFSAVTAPLSIYEGIERLQPGFFLVYEKGVVRQSRYWDLEYVESKNGSEGYWEKELREQMRAAVHRNLADCDVENTGAYLSGGTDSSSVVAFMSEQFAQPHSYSISFPVTGYNEIEYARTTAKCFRSRHHELCLSPKDAIDAIPKVMAYYDEPFANSSALASYPCALLARQNGMETLLAGDGGDELFAGNERYESDRRFAIYQTLPLWLRKGFIEPLTSLLPNDESRLGLPRRYVRRANIPNPRRIFSYSVFLSEAPSDIFESSFLSRAVPGRWMEIANAHYDEARASTELNRLMHLDIKIILADNDLRKVSGTAELANIRVRYPLLDRRLAEFSGTIPSRLKLKGSQKRYIFKKAMTGILPNEILYKTKHGFGVPIGNWFLHDAKLKSLAQEVLTDTRTRQRGYFRADFYNKVADLHRRDHAAYYGEIIWYLVALELWHREHLEGRVRGSLRED
jgi:asparagine synthase (glutamine-hydrolysing)